MKTYKLMFFLLILAAGLIMQSCKDNILKPVTNNKSADSLTALINAMQNKLISVNAKDNTFKIQLLKFKSEKDSLNAVSPANDPYGQSVEYTVYLVDGGNSVFGTGQVGGRSSCKGCKVAGVDGASVTVLSNGQSYSATSADGRAIFGGLKVAGLVTVNITATGYTSCSFTTYFNPSTDDASTTGSTFSASTNIMLLPTTGANTTNYTGQVYINKSTLDDTLGRMYNDPTDAARYQTFVKNSSYGPYHGTDQEQIGSYLYGDNFGAYGAQNIKFDKLTALSGVKFIYGYPSNVASYYQAYDLNYHNLPGDIISVTYTGMTSYATVDANGVYTLSIPTYANNPGVSIGTTYSDWAGSDGNNINYQDSLSYLVGSGSQLPGSKPVVIKYYDNSTYGVTPLNYDKVTVFYEYFPFIEMDPPSSNSSAPADYSEIDQDPQYFNGQPGQTYTRNIFFFGSYPTGS